jgi:Na+/H+ antiporter NhaC
MRSKLLIGLILSSFISYGGSSVVDAGWLGLIPAIVAVVLSIVTKEVLSSLFLAVIVGSFIVFFKGGLPDSYFFGLENAIDLYIVSAASDEEHVSVIIFSLLIAGMVSVLKHSNGMHGVIQGVSKFAKTKRSALFTTYFMGMVVFFDDYANTLIVGNTMKSITDKFNISREKLAYIVDATAAPIACIALVSTWIGYEVQLIDEGIKISGLQSVIGTGYSAFLQSISYSFYPLITLIFIFVLIYLQKDFGEMLKVERKQSSSKESSTELLTNTPVYKGILPIVVLIIVSFFGIYVTGSGSTFTDHIQSGNSIKGLLWGSASSLFIAMLINISRGLKKNVKWVVKGFQELLPAILTLVLAWALNGVLKDLGLGQFLGSLLSESEISFHWVPLITFALSSIIAFSTGSSFSTMSILFPIVISISTSFILSSPTEDVISLFYGCLASVLSGAVLGDHCSPISDTTILSSMATGCDHVSHVRTQMPYALIVGAMSALMIVLSTVFLVPTIILLILSILLSYLIIRIIGK